MIFKFVGRYFIILTALLIISVPSAARAVDLIVEHNPSFDSTHFSTVQAAINYAANVISTAPTGTTNFRILVQADLTPYFGAFTPISNVPIIGSSTSGTFLSGAGTLISLNSVSSVSVRNFTFLSANVGISIINSSAISITNNVFHLGSTGTAIQIQNLSAAVSSSPSIVNNTFYNTGTAISTNANTPIINNIFSSNTNAISTTTALTQVIYDAFFNNSVIGIASDTGQFTTADPLFVNPAGGDFHLQSGSPCVGSGNYIYTNSFNSSSDMGAYGGQFSDIFIPVVTGLTANLTTNTTSASITLNWNATGSNLVKAYRIYYGTSSGNYNGSQATEGLSPLTVPVSGTSQTLSGLSDGGSAAPSAPAFTSAVPNDQALLLSWTTVPGATGYRVYYSTSNFNESSLPVTYVDVNGGNVSSYQLSGLANGTRYFVAMAAFTQSTLYSAVTAVINTNIASAPGSTNESSYSQEISKPVGHQQVSAISNILSDYPETLSSYPNLKKEGCFIATAAYGFYSAPQVQALRDFRDRYLMTNVPGRAFVAWYYHYGPLGAHFITTHPYLRPLVRIILFPLVCGSIFLKNPSTSIQMVMLVLIILTPVIIIWKKKLQIIGGSR